MLTTAIKSALLSLMLSMDTHPIIPTENMVCMTEAIYREASNQSMQGKMAVANVIINRTKTAGYPSTVCGVIHQKGQFSFNNKKYKQGKTNFSNPGVAKQIEESALVAIKTLNGEMPDNTKGATFFVNHGWATDTKWLGVMKKTASIGAHTFYKSRRTQ